MERSAKPQQSTSAKSKDPPRPSAPQKPGTDYPEVRTSSVDVNADPTYDPAGKPVTQLDFDADLAEHDKPWRRPGSDQSEYFNYGFDEFTWTLYCEKQKMTREGAKAQTAEFQSMMGGVPTGMPGMPVMPGMGQQQQSQPGQGQQAMPQMPGAMPGMPGMPGMPDADTMNKMMQMMASQGMDPNQMDFGNFMQMAQQMPGGQSGMGGPGYGQGGMMEGPGGGGGGQRNYGGRGRRGRW